MDSVRERSIRLPGDFGSVRAARRFVVETVSGDTSELELMVSELVANVVRHVGSELTLTVRLGPPIRVEVHNHEAATEAFRELVTSASMPDRTSVGNRGLAIVRTLATDIGLSDDHGDGKVVWFEYSPRN